MNKHPAERRRHKRFPVIRDLAEPLEIVVMGAKSFSLPGILTNLSAGGLDLILMGRLEQKGPVQITLNNIPSLDGYKISGRIVWTMEKGETSMVGIQFSGLPQEQENHINAMATSYWECESRIEGGEFEICFRECSYWNLCTKTSKLK